MDPAHLERFAGIGRLYGRAGMERLARASFMVVGLGGVGSWTAEALARSGVGHLALVDGDSVCVSNTNRQLHAVAGNLGKAKTTAVAERVRAIHPAIRTTEHTRFLSRFNPHEVLAGFAGVVIDAMDAPTRFILSLGDEDSQSVRWASIRRVRERFLMHFRA